MSSVPTVSQIPGSVLDTVTATNLANSSISVPTEATWQPPITVPTTIVSPTQAVSNTIVVPGTGGTSGGGGSPSGIPAYVTSVAAAESPYKNKNGQMFTVVSVSFDPPVDVNWSGIQIWFSGYNGNPYPQLMTTGHISPVSFLVETTKETVLITVNSVSPLGVFPLFATAPTTTLTINGVLSNPSPPSIANSLSVTPTGYQFQFNYIAGLAADVIMGYNIYKNSSNSFPGTAGFLKAVSQPSNLTADPSATGIYTYQETVPLGSVDYYWVTSVNQIGLESTPEFAGDATAVTPIDIAGNLKLKNILNANQGTADLVFPNGVTQLGNMTITAVFKGNPILLLFTANVRSGPNVINGAGGAFFIYKDGVLLAPPTCTIVYGNTQASQDWRAASLSYLDLPSAGSHNYTIKFNYTAPGAYTLSRMAIVNWSEMQIVELG